MGPTCNVRHEQVLEMGQTIESGLRTLVLDTTKTATSLRKNFSLSKWVGSGWEVGKTTTQYFRNLFGQNFDFQKDAKVWGVLQIGKVVPIYDLDFSQIWKLCKIHRFFGKSGFEPKWDEYILCVSFKRLRILMPELTQRLTFSKHVWVWNSFFSRRKNASPNA